MNSMHLVYVYCIDVQCKYMYNQGCRKHSECGGCIVVLKWRVYSGTKVGGV